MEGPGSSDAPGHFHYLVCLDHVPDLHVVEAGELHAAFQARPNITGVLLEPLQAIQFPSVLYDYVVPDDSDLGIAGDLALGDETSGDRPHSGNLEQLPYLGAL